MDYIKKLLLLFFAVSALASVWISRVSSQLVRDDYTFFTNTVFIVSLILLLCFYVIDKPKKNNKDTQSMKIKPYKAQQLTRNTPLCFVLRSTELKRQID